MFNPCTRKYATKKKNNRDWVTSFLQIKTDYFRLIVSHTFMEENEFLVHDRRRENHKNNTENRKYGRNGGGADLLTWSISYK